MKQDDIQPPRVTSGPGYPEAFAVQLETELSALRELIARQSSDGHLFDKRIAVDTPGLGEGHVKCSVCLPNAPGSTPEFPAPLPLIILLEGGGFALGQPSDGEANARFVSDKLDAVVVSLDYAKAPRYPFPHALLQAYDVLKWSISPAAVQTLGVAADPSRVTVVGCSAGGNLATSLSLLVAFTAGPTAPFRAALGPQFRQVAQVLVYPCLALHERYGERFARASPEAQAKSIPVVMLEKMEAAYVPPYVDGRQIFVAPMRADLELLRELRPTLAPMLTFVAGLDALDKEAVEYVEQFRGAGIEAAVKIYPEAAHAYTHGKEGDARWREEDARVTWERVCDFVSRKMCHGP